MEPRSSPVYQSIFPAGYLLAPVATVARTGDGWGALVYGGLAYGAATLVLVAVVLPVESNGSSAGVTRTVRGHGGVGT